MNKKYYLKPTITILAFFALFLSIFFIVTKKNKKADSTIPPSINAQSSESLQKNKRATLESDPELLLPDLQVKPLETVYIITKSDGNRTLRFPGTFTNTGDGPLELVGTPDEKSQVVRATQQVYKKDGEKEERFVGNFVFHHSHTHRNRKDNILHT